MLVSPFRSLGFGLVLLAAAPALASSDSATAPDSRIVDSRIVGSRVAVAFGNTVVSTYPDGRTQEIWLRPDGAWSGLSRDHRDLAGKWALKGDKVCLRQQTPPTLPFSYCTPFPADTRVGAAWTSKDFSGTPIRLKLVHGVQTSG